MNVATERSTHSSMRPQRALRIGIVSQFYAPEPGPAQLPANLAEGLAARGHSVRVVTGFPNYPTGTVMPGYRLTRRMDEVRHGVDVRRVYLHPDHGSALGRITNYGSFALSAIGNGLGHLRHADVIWVNASPITLAWPIWALKAHRVPVVSHILDLWPESLYASGFASMADHRAASRLLEGWTSSIYRASDHVAYIAPGVRDLLLSRGVPEAKLHHIPMWADEATFHPGGVSVRTDLGISPDAVVLLYAGALGEAQGLEALVDACALVDDPRFVCVIAGSGSSESALRSRAAGMNQVRFIGRVSQDAMTDLLASADASFVSLRDTPLGRVSIPSKTQAALASGTPVVVAATGDVRELVDARGLGWTADPGSPQDIARAIGLLLSTSTAERASMGEHARSVYESDFSLERAIGRLETLLRSAATQTPQIGAPS
ncbi:hypothetical protein ASG73_16310 [Janibacter sp. Soil728]|uniref:glycosyltransferase family 4 protein n=1 Tax=Janibacter sp. Soil728 TaxID=1736393 RepID=UPI0006FD11EB|nr:glycosyltransferase family 4 protein [Janibacter sp. Soil728]KRE35497.1 hypothetical protein ASG73_16310 [Janibacter sp. Soil728]